MLSILGTAEAIPAIHPLLEHENPDARGAVIRAIGKLRDSSDLYGLEAYFEDVPLDARSEALIALIRGNTGAETKKHAIEIIEEMTRNIDESVRAKAAYVIGETRVKQLLGTFLELPASNSVIVVVCLQ